MPDQDQNQQSGQAPLPKKEEGLPPGEPFPTEVPPPSPIPTQGVSEPQSGEVVIEPTGEPAQPEVVQTPVSSPPSRAESVPEKVATFGTESKAEPVFKEGVAQEAVPVSAPEPLPKEEVQAPETVTPPGPKRKFPKKIVLVVAGVFIILFVAFSLFKFVFNRGDGGEGGITSKEVEITWWGLWEDEVILKSIINEYQQTKPNVKIKYVKQSPQDYRERLTSTLAKGGGPDVFRYHNTWVPMLRNELDNVPASVMSTADFAQTYYPVITSDVASGTGLVGVPMGYDALTLFVNEKMFKEAGINHPATWVELREAAKSLTKKENGKIVQAGVAMGRTENVDHWSDILGLMMLQNGVDLSNPEGRNTEDVITYYTLFSRADGVWDETLPQSTVAFAAGKVAMYFGPSWRAFNIKEQNPDLEFVTISLPQLPKESPDEPSISYATYWVEGVWARSENKDVAWDFIKFLSQSSTLEKFYKGASDARGFGEAYPRADMQELLLDHPILGPIISLAPSAQGWYLADRTYDGDTGINSQINSYFEDAINGVNNDVQIEDVMKTLTPGVIQVLTQYGLVQ